MLKYNNGKKPAPTKIPSTEELRIFSKQTISLLEHCIKKFEPAHELRDKIIIGLLTKMLKTYRSVFYNADMGDSETPEILVRIIYELALTTVFLLISEDEEKENYLLFKKTSLSRLHNTILELNQLEGNNKEAIRNVIEKLEYRLKEENFVREETTNIKYPKSWHPDISYQKMAKLLGGEFEEFYIIFYEVTSTVTHPNWLNLEKNHIHIENDMGYSKVESPELQIFPLCTATCLLLRTAEICAIKLTVKNKKKNKIFLKKIREVHYLMHNGRPKALKL